MLPTMPEEDRLLRDEDIRWYRLETILQNKSKFNFFITTDYATSEKQAADYSVTSVWAYNSNGDWFWVDGVVKRQDMGKNMSDLFRLAQKWRPMGVGIEVSGQQAGFIPWIQDQMLVRNTYFTLVSEGNKNEPGIRPTTNKMVRFNTMVPMFKAGKMYFPSELKQDPRMLEFINELSLAAVSGFRSKHDDCLDSISMLALMKGWKRCEEAPMEVTEGGMWEVEGHDDGPDRMSSYVV